MKRTNTMRGTTADNANSTAGAGVVVGGIGLLFVMPYSLAFVHSRVAYALAAPPSYWEPFAV